MNDFNPQVGDGVTMTTVNDRNPGTVVKRTAKTVVVQADTVDGERNPNGYTVTYTLRGNGKWKMRGISPKAAGMTISAGRTFYRNPSF